VFDPSVASHRRPETFLNQRSSCGGPVQGIVWETKPSRSFYDGRTSPGIGGSEVAKTAEHLSRLGMRMRVRPSARAHPRKNTGVVLVVGALATSVNRH